MSQRETDYKALVEELEAHVRAGRNASVLERLQKLIWSQVPRPWLSPLADLARRIQQPILTLRIMNPILRHEGLLTEPPTPAEKIVYATALTMIGFSEEAEELLAEVDPRQDPDALLYRSFAAFGKWDYRATYPWLQRFVRSPKITEYRQLVGKVNLLSAYIAEGDLAEAKPLAEELRETTHSLGHQLLSGNSLELSAQISIFEGDYAQALQFIKEGEVKLISAPGIYHEFTKKWRLIAELLLDSQNPHRLQELRSFLDGARKNRLWEIVRDCELFLAFAAQDTTAWQKVVRGTPFPSYRRRAERLWPSADSNVILFNRSFSLQLGQGEKVFDSQDLALQALPTQALLLWSLTQDFYKPVSTGQLFHRLFPGEYFSPTTSVKRVHNVVYRFRNWLKEKNWPLRVEVRDLEFFLQGDAELTVYRSRPEASKSRLAHFHQIWGAREFSTRDLARVLGISQRAAQELLRREISGSRLQSRGQGRARLYRFGNRLSKPESIAVRRIK
jgi:hypothetical protein